MAKITREYHIPSQLPIYSVTYHILKECIYIMTHMGKDIKHTIGQKLINLSLDAISCLNTAFYSPSDKIASIRKYVTTIDCIEQLINICVDSSNTSILALRESDYVKITPYIANAKKQGIGWYNSMSVEEQKFPESITAEVNGE